MGIKLFKTAGFSDKDVAAILGITTVMVWKYKNGAATSKERGGLIEEINALLYRLMEQGKLPLKRKAGEPVGDFVARRSRAAEKIRAHALSAVAQNQGNK